MNVPALIIGIGVVLVGGLATFGFRDMAETFRRSQARLFGSEVDQRQARLLALGGGILVTAMGLLVVTLVVVSFVRG